MGKRAALGTKLLITAPLLIGGSYILLEYVSDSLPVVILIMIGMVIWFAYNIKYVFFSKKDNN